MGLTAGEKTVSTSVGSSNKSSSDPLGSSFDAAVAAAVAAATKPPGEPASTPPSDLPESPSPSIGSAERQAAADARALAANDAGGDPQNIINPSTGRGYTDAELRQLAAESQAAADARALAVNDSGGDPQNIINPSTGQGYTDAELGELVAERDTEEQAAADARALAVNDAGGDPQNIINPSTGQGYTDAELRQLVAEREAAGDPQATADARALAANDAGEDPQHIINPSTGRGYTDAELRELVAEREVDAQIEGLVEQQRAKRDELQEEVDQLTATGLQNQDPYIADQIKALNEEIASLDADIDRYENGQRPLFLNLSNDDSRDVHASAAGIDRELLDATIKHEGGNFNQPFGDGWRFIQETANDLSDIVLGRSIDTSVGYAQIQPRNAVEIARETFGLELTEEEARELLTTDDEFSTAIAAEFLAQRAELVDPSYRDNQVVFTSYAMSEELIEQFNSVGWDFDEAKKLVESGEMPLSSYENTRLRYEEAWPNAVDSGDGPETGEGSEVETNEPSTSGHIPAPVGPGGPDEGAEGGSVFDDNPNVNNAGIPVGR